MKKLFLIVVCTTALVAANAQARFGLKAGANLASLTDADGTKSKIGINGGLQVALSLNEMFSVNPEAVYSSQGAKAEEGDDVFNLNYINVPVLLQYNNPSGFFAHTGPQVGFLMSAKAELDGVEVDMKDATNSIDFSWAIGAGFATKSGFGFNARYNIGLSKLDKEGEGTSKNSVIQAGIFYNFNGGASKK